MASLLLVHTGGTSHDKLFFDLGLTLQLQLQKSHGQAEIYDLSFVSILGYQPHLFLSLKYQILLIHVLCTHH